MESKTIKKINGNYEIPNKIIFALLLIIILMISACRTNKNRNNIKAEASNEKQDIRLKIIKDSLRLTSEQFNTIKNKDSIINEVYLSIKDTLPITIIKQNLDSFYAKKYTEKEFTTNLELYRVFKGENISIGIKRNVDPSKVPSFDNIEDLKKFIEKHRVKSPNTRVKIKKDTTSKKENKKSNNN